MKKLNCKYFLCSLNLLYKATIFRYQRVYLELLKRNLIADVIFRPRCNIWKTFYLYLNQLQDDQ